MENNELSKIEERLAKFREEKEKEEQRRIEKEKNLYELEKNLYEVNTQLEKEKGRRIIILIIIYSVFAGCNICHFNKTMDFETILFTIFLSLVFGVLLWIIPLSIFHLVTDWFTNIFVLEDRKRHLEERIEAEKVDAILNKH